MIKQAAVVAVLGFVGYAIFGPNPDIVALESFPQRGPHRIEGSELEAEGFTRTDVMFASVDGQRCHGWFYMPTGQEAKPGIAVMASGLGAQMDFGMEAYAETFAQSGVAALLFDYRSFGSSEGMPRNLINPWKHLEDWRSGIDFVKTDPSISSKVDVDSLFLWGSSFAGGHVLVIASELGDSVKGVVSQIPHLDGRENRKRNIMAPPTGRGLLGVLRISRASLQDLVRSALGLSPAYINIVGEPGSVSLMPMSAEGLKKYYQKQPEEGQKGGGWQNMAPARIALMTGLYSPIDHVKDITAPVLFITAAEDQLCPPELIKKAADLDPMHRVVTIMTDHFGIYSGQHLKASATEAATHFKTLMK